MASAEAMRRYRATDERVLTQVRLDPATVEKLDRLVQERGLSGRAAVVEELLNGEHAAPEPEPKPVWLGWP